MKILGFCIFNKNRKFGIGFWILFLEPAGLQYKSKLRCPFSQQKQNKITTKTLLKNKTNQNTQRHIKSKPSFCDFFVFVLICCDFVVILLWLCFVFVLINGHFLKKMITKFKKKYMVSPRGLWIIVRKNEFQFVKLAIRAGVLQVCIWFTLKLIVHNVFTGGCTSQLSIIHHSFHIIWIFLTYCE